LSRPNADVIRRRKNRDTPTATGRTSSRAAPRSHVPGGRARSTPPPAVVGPPPPPDKLFGPRPLRNHPREVRVVRRQGIPDGVVEHRHPRPRRPEIVLVLRALRAGCGRANPDGSVAGRVATSPVRRGYGLRAKIPHDGRRGTSLNRSNALSSACPSGSAVCGFGAAASLFRFRRP
jgi:hypothetical protein